MTHATDCPVSLGIGADCRCKTPADANVSGLASDPYAVRPSEEPAAAGRELDALVATLVMGWTEVQDVPYRETHWDHLTFRYSGNRPTGFRPGKSQSLQEVPAFSTSIAAAWEIVDKASEMGYHARVKSPFMPGELYWAGFTPHGSTGWNGRPDYEGSGETAALAICRAALRLATANRPAPTDASA